MKKRKLLTWLTKKKKVLLFAKFLFIFLMLGIMQVLASEYSQSTKLTISLKDASVPEILAAIQSQSEFEFFYSDEQVDKNKKIDINVVDATVEEVLKLCFKDSNLDYEIIDKVIIIKPLGQKASPHKETKSGGVEVKGKVTDKKGMSLLGATVLIKGTSMGTITDANGNYSIEVPEGAVLVFSFVGFQKQEVVVSAEDTDVNVEMQEAAAELGEVTVISTGYQKIKPEQSTGSITTIRTKEYESRINTTDFLTGLQNKIPGLLINNDIEFEGNSLFQIRGISTINGNKNPLIVVDGYPTELSLDMINPNEIESVTVLKDAAAATVYGVRSSNGVIVIERKKAKAGKPFVNFRATASFTPKENYERYRWDKEGGGIDYYLERNKTIIHPGLYYLMNNPYIGANFNYPPLGIIMAKKAAHIITEDEANEQIAELRSYNNAKDYGRLFLRTAVAQTYNLDISGGNENLLYYMTANYSGNTATQINNDNSRFILSGRATIKLSNRFTLDLTTDFLESKSTSVPIPNINNIYPYEQFQDEDGNPLSLFNGSIFNPFYCDYMMSIGMKDNRYYPLVDINEITDKTRTLNNRITVNFRYDLGNGFKLSFGGVYETSRRNNRYLANENSSVVNQLYNYYTAKEANKAVPYLPEGGFLKQQTSSRESYTLRAQLNYDKQINENHSINVILGWEVRDVLDKSNSAAYFGYNDQTLLHKPIDNTLLTGSFNPGYARSNNLGFYYSNLFQQKYTDNRYFSIYSNLVYSYKRKYSFSGSMRIDQSNLFGTDPKYHYKPLWSIGAGWNIQKENFMQNVNWIGSLKFRIAYGFIGNVANNALPQVIAQSGFNDLNPAAYIRKLTLLSYANSGLRWEQTRNLNIGLDYTIFKNISGSIDYYIKKSTDLLANNQIDATKGGNSTILNLASIRNNGLEISLHADWIRHKTFNWNTGLIFSYNSSKVLSVYNENNMDTETFAYTKTKFTNYIDGYAVGAIFNYRYAGINSEGDLLIYNEDGEPEEFTYNAGLGYVDYVGSSIPTMNLGLSNRVDIGNFYVYCMINYYGGFKIRVPVPDPSATRPLEGAGNFWKEPGDENNPDVLPSLSYFFTSYLSYTDKYTVSGAYLTLGDLTVSYSLRNSKLVKKIGISNFEVRAQASNLFTVGFNKYNYSKATRSYAKSYLTPTYTIGVYVNF